MGIVARGISLPKEEVKTTFWMDFSIADRFGETAVRDTYERAFSEWKSDYRYLTNLVVTLNYKAWDHSERNEELSELYTELYEKTSAYAGSTLKGKELDYYFEITD